MFDINKDSKKVAIITFHRADNYGAVLQAYALQQVLRKEEHQVNILDYRDNFIESGYRLININKKSISGFIKSVVSTILFFSKKLKRRKNFKEFRDHYLMLTEKEYKMSNEVDEDVDVLITGSDQVWNTEITNGLSDIYTLNFGTTKSKRISYAASIGQNGILKEDILDFKNKLKKLNSISVREESAKQALLSLFPEKQIEVVLDPVLLRTSEEWKEDIKNISDTNEKYIFAYYVQFSKEYKDIVELLSKKTGLKIVNVEKRSKFHNTLFNAYEKGPMEFVNLIKNAEYVVTSSFHGTVFSIIFHKKFWVVPTTGTSRITDLLELLGISERIISTADEFETKKFDQDIDYVMVDISLNGERKKSIDWLNNVINK